MDEMSLGRAELEIGVKGDLKQLLDKQRRAVEALEAAEARLGEQSQANLELEKEKLRWMESTKGLSLLRQELELKRQMAAVRERPIAPESNLRAAGSPGYDRPATPTVAGPAGDLRDEYKDQTAALKGHLDLSFRVLAVTREEVRAAQAKSKYLASPEGKRALREQIDLSRRLAAEQKKMDWARNVADKGTVGAYFGAFEEAINKASEALSGLFRAGAVATGGIGALVASANPSAFSTLRGSFEAVSIQLGRFFVPVVDELSRALQQLAGWFKGLDEDTRKQIVTWAGWIAKAALAAVALKSVLLVVGMMGSALKGLHSIMVGITAHPLLAVTALVAGLAAKWYLARDAAKEASAVMSGVRGPNAGAKPPTAAQALETIDPAIRARLNAAKDDKERKAILEEEEKKQEKKVEELQAQQEVADRAGVGKPEQEVLFQQIQEMIRRMFPNRPIDEVVNAMTVPFGARPFHGQAPEAAATLNQILQAQGILKPGQSTPFDVRRILRGENVNLRDILNAPDKARLSAEQQQLEALRVAQGKGKGGKDDDFLRNWEVPFQSRFMNSFSQYGEAAQLAALNMGDLDAANLGEQMKNMLEWQRQHGDNIPVLQELQGIREALAGMGF